MSRAWMMLAITAAVVVESLSVYAALALPVPAMYVSLGLTQTLLLVNLATFIRRK